MVKLFFFFTYNNILKVQGNFRDLCYSETPYFLLNLLISFDLDTYVTFLAIFYIADNFQDIWIRVQAYGIMSKRIALFQKNTVPQSNFHTFSARICQISLPRSWKTMHYSCTYLGRSWKKMSDLARSCEKRVVLERSWKKIPATP